MSETRTQLEEQRHRVQGLQVAVYSQADPSAAGALLADLALETSRLHELEQKLSEETKQTVGVTPGKTRGAGRFLGANTTELRVEVQLLIDPLPTGAYHLMDPETDPLVSVAIENLSRDIRRICVKTFIEGISAQSVRTVEIEPRQTETLRLQPTLFPDRARSITEVQRATLHVIVEDLDGKHQEKFGPRKQLECHNTYTITCLSRTASFNSVRRPDTGESVDLSHYYGAWVTPHNEDVQERIRAAVASMPDQRMLGYQGDPDVVKLQVAALYQALRAAEIVYVNSVIDYGAAAGLSTQRTRLPRESLAARSANCIDGTVLMASLIEGVSLNPAIVLVPGHAFVGWETWRGSGEWQFLETTMIGSGEFEAACESGKRQHEQYAEFNQDRLKIHSVSDLRQRGIWPME